MAAINIKSQGTGRKHGSMCDCFFETIYKDSVQNMFLICTEIIKSLVSTEYCCNTEHSFTHFQYWPHHVCFFMPDVPVLLSVSGVHLSQSFWHLSHIYYMPRLSVPVISTVCLSLYKQFLLSVSVITIVCISHLYCLSQSYLMFASVIFLGCIDHFCYLLQSFRLLVSVISIIGSINFAVSHI